MVKMSLYVLMSPSFGTIPAGCVWIYIDAKDPSRSISLNQACS
jgi:hypothetical protein